MGDAGLKGRLLCKLFVQVQRIEISADPGKEIDIRFRDRLAKTISL